MGIITGQEYIDRINALEADVWIDGEQVKGMISEHNAFSGVMKSQARLYDLQSEHAKSEIMTFKSPTTDNRIGTSFLEPKTKEDLEKRRLMTSEWARINLGMMGRSPDYMNTALMAVYAGAEVFSSSHPQFANNITRFYEEASENDYSFTHTFINPQTNRSQLHFEDGEKIIAAKVIDKNKDGIIVHGARLLATQGGITDELIVFPSGGNLYSKDFAYAFSIPSNTKGLTFLCRESFVYSNSTFNHPLGSRFEEMDTIIVFDHVLVPWERVFLYESIECVNKLYTETSFYPLILHQVVSRQVIKIESLLGVAQLIVDTINISEYQHVQEKISEIIVGLETLKALLIASEVNAKIDKWGTMVPEQHPLYSAINLFPRMYPRFTEILQLLGASGLVSIPTEKDFLSDKGSDLHTYLQAANASAIDRVKLFRLAWDICLSAFGSRQILYERFFFGDPVRLASNLYRGYERKALTNRIHDFLKEMK
ncbi:4-hydroxyphenylacetate 3-monooxygenase, oxygenase component [Fredinandcohnia quinoae]|uniref:4-hydroxyphenylacetate 3-monooxygenase, oxygenase component n=1 Tax=Fredinandcohnia quinoae TaxID=2918902 RepID=A0AAW5E2C7_9BACI|nr:4-hydroxyphenylacetate 3-monooxygenase, oxygenase component [Fredinandcohnia sp. SECRCQ15]MCH1627062.1 4-hydroxyphenylacetate 3-monooxygenase, oxygenase component [Fredinandcohnia sp. SECRCQ15]